MRKFSDYLKINNLTEAGFYNGIRNDTIKYKIFTLEEIIKKYDNNDLNDIAETDIITIKIEFEKTIEIYRKKGEKLIVTPFWKKPLT